MSEQTAASLNDDLSAGLDTAGDQAPARRKRAAKADATGATRPSDERVGIIIAESDNPKDTHVFVSVNGYAYHIKRGERVDVPREVIHVLENAVESRLVQVGEGRHELKSFHRYPFRTVQ